MSAKVPAASANNTTGNVVADCTAATISGEPVCSAITQEAATSLIQVPILLPRMASHRARKIGWRSGAQAPASAGGIEAVVIATLQNGKTRGPARRPRRTLHTPS